MEIRIPESDVKRAAEKGMDDFVQLFHDRLLQAAGGSIDQHALEVLSADQITLLAYVIVRDEVMEGGFIQLIHNGYGPFIFINPFAKAIKQWGLGELAKIIYDGRRLYEAHKEALTAEVTDEEFMALYEQYAQFDDLDDAFVSSEEEFTAAVAHYIDEHLEAFAVIDK